MQHYCESIVKKFATDKGNANKDLMYEHFCKDTKTDLMKTFDMQTLSNPITDIVDSYYIARCYESANVNNQVPQYFSRGTSTKLKSEMFPVKDILVTPRKNGLIKKMSAAFTESIEAVGMMCLLY